MTGLRRDMARPRHPEAGFTLVELLVVVLILGILASISISIYIAQVHKAHRAQAIQDGQTFALELADALGDYTSLGSAGGVLSQTAGSSAIVVGDLGDALGPAPSGPGTIPAKELSQGTVVIGSTRPGTAGWCAEVAVSDQRAIVNEHGYLPDAQACIAGTAS